MIVMGKLGFTGGIAMTDGVLRSIFCARKSEGMLE